VPVTLPQVALRVMPIAVEFHLDRMEPARVRGHRVTERIRSQRGSYTRLRHGGVRHGSR
jgi:hypothetical protein